jgi:hypothetical protein
MECTQEECVPFGETQIVEFKLSRNSASYFFG